MKTSTIAPLVATWFALLVLLALTTASAYLDLGFGNTLLNLVIAGVKVALIAVFFMHLGQSDGAVRIAAVAALFFLFILAFLAFSDILSRPSHPAPWHEPARESRGTDPALTY
jgi:cytochrome c oxidase subunit 4